MKTESRGHISEGCRSKIAKNDTANTPCTEGNHIPWPQEDCIRWAEWRIRELTIDRGEYVDECGKWLLEEKAAGGRKIVPGDEVADYAVWLLKERDGLSWHQIAYRFFPTATEEDIEKYESRVRRIREIILEPRTSNHRGFLNSTKFYCRPSHWEHSQSTFPIRLAPRKPTARRILQLAIGENRISSENLEFPAVVICHIPVIRSKRG